MKALYVLPFLLLSTLFLYAQQPAKKDTIIPSKGNVDKQLKNIKERKVELHSDSTGNQPKKSHLVDTTVLNKYGDLLADDTAYNKKYPLWKPAIQVLSTNLLLLGVDRYVFKYDFSTQVGLNSWNHNIKAGWEWDVDRFGINFIGHPYTGGIYFNAGRSQGYGYFQSFGFAVEGSILWEYFGENTRPSYNDIINTPVNGAFFGEILYRLSSNVLDDRTRGLERVSREVLAGLIDPKRGFDRLLQGKTWRKTNKEVYQKEPLNITLYGGAHLINEGRSPNFQKGTTSEMVNVQFDYGNPFENRFRKPFDFFKLRADFNIGVGRKILDNVTGYGVLFSKNVAYKKNSFLFGAFQYYDYWDNKTFELGAISFGAGAFSKVPITKAVDLYTNIHLGIIPFAGNSTRFGPDTSQVRDYIFGGGLQGKIESTLNLSKYATLSLIYNYYFIRTYVGTAGNNFIGILKPRVTIHIFEGLSAGFEHFIYYNDRALPNFPALHSVRTEQKIFLLYYFEDKQRKGHYN